MPTALITGPTAGLGKAYATALAARGFDLVLVARDTDRLEELSKTLSSSYQISCEVLSADLADDEALARVEERLSDRSRPVDWLINNAGFGLGKGFRGSTIEEEELLIDVLVRAVLRLTKAALGPMLDRRNGTIVNVSSVSGFVAYGTYGAAKAWVTSFTESVYSELAGTGVRVLAVCPGFVHTEFHQRAGIKKGQLPGFMWLGVDDIIDATLKHLDQGRRSPVLVPSLRYRALVFAARHAPRGLVLGGARRARTTQGRV